MRRYIIILLGVLYCTVPITAQPTTEIILDIPYIDNGTIRQQLDLYLPSIAPDETGYPILFMIHGGGFVFGNRTDLQDAALRYADLGYAVVVPSYRLAPDFTYPAAYEDVFCAYAWMFQHAESYQLDTESLVIIGESAGANIGALLATVDEPDFFLSECAYTIPDDHQPQSMIALYLFTDLATCECPFVRTSISLYLDVAFSAWDDSSAIYEALPQASIFYWLDADDPPFYLIHGDNDVIVPMSESEEFYSIYADLGGTVDIVILENVGHGFFPTDSHRATQQSYSIINQWLDIEQ